LRIGASIPRTEHAHSQGEFITDPEDLLRTLVRVNRHAARFEKIVARGKPSRTDAPAASTLQLFYAQVEVANKIGILQTLVTDYENDGLRLTAEMALRWALALGVTVDELLRPQSAKTARRQPGPQGPAEAGEH
jgi:hypothetical protein